MTERPRITYAFFCEQVRNELGGQVTCVGLWGHRATVPTVPVALAQLALHFHVTNRAHEPGLARVRLVLPSGNDATVELPFRVTDGATGHNLTVHLSPFPIDAIGTLTAEITLVTSGELLADERSVALEFAVSRPAGDPPLGA